MLAYIESKPFVLVVWVSGLRCVGLSLLWLPEGGSESVDEWCG